MRVVDVSFHAMPAILLTIDLLFLSPPWTIRALPYNGIELYDSHRLLGVGGAVLQL